MLKIEWEDHFSTSGWQTGKTNTNPVIVKSTGYVVEDTPKVIVLAQSIAENDNSSGNHMAIIKKCITARKELK